MVVTIIIGIEIVIILAPVDTQTTDTRPPRHVVMNSRMVEYMASDSLVCQCAALYVVVIMESASSVLVVLVIGIIILVIIELIKSP